MQVTHTLNPLLTGRVQLPRRVCRRLVRAARRCAGWRKLRGKTGAEMRAEREKHRNGNYRGQCKHNPLPLERIATCPLVIRRPAAPSWTHVRRCTPSVGQGCLLSRLHNRVLQSLAHMPSHYMVPPEPDNQAALFYQRGRPPGRPHQDCRVPPESLHSRDPWQVLRWTSRRVGAGDHRAPCAPF